MKALWITVPVALVPLVWALAAAGQAPVTREPTRVAFVSSQRILNESPAARAEVARFQASRQQTAKELRSKQQALQATRLKLAQADTDAARSALQKQEEQQRADLERATAQAQTDLQAEQRQLLAELQTQIKPVVEQLANSQGIDVVLNADTALMWGSVRLDLTAAVLERLKTKPAEGVPTAKP